VELTNFGKVLAIIGVAAIIFIGGLVGFFLLLFPGTHLNNINNNNSATSSSSSSSITTTKTCTSGTSCGGATYSLRLLKAGSGPMINSTFKTLLGNTYYQDDAPGDGGTYLYTYNDNGHMWSLGGDFEPSIAWASANKTGLTLSDETCIPPPLGTRGVRDCGPWHEWNGDNREEAWTTLFAYLRGIPTTAQVFSVYAYIPYHTYYQSCVYNVSPTGCSYEGSTPYDSADFSVVANGPFYHAVVISFAEVCNGKPPCQSNELEIEAYTSAGGSSTISVLAKYFVPQYTPLHKLTIETDRKSYIDMFVDNTLVYSNTTMPIDMNTNSVDVNLFQFTTINNETDSTTWSNFTAYSNPTITVSGLPQGSEVIVNGTNGFSTSLANPISNGTVTINVSPELPKFIVGVELNGTILATYKETVGSGAALNLVASS
jgi:hypothetical protein